MTPPENLSETSMESGMGANGTGATIDAPVVRINHLQDFVGKQVTLQGWLYHKTGKGKLQFLQVRDGSGIC